MNGLSCGKTCDFCEEKAWLRDRETLDYLCWYILTYGHCKR